MSALGRSPAPVATAARHMRLRKLPEQFPRSWNVVGLQVRDRFGEDHFDLESKRPARFDQGRARVPAVFRTSDRAGLDRQHAATRPQVSPELKPRQGIARPVERDDRSTATDAAECSARRGRMQSRLRGSRLVPWQRACHYDAVEADFGALLMQRMAEVEVIKRHDWCRIGPDHSTVSTIRSVEPPMGASMRR